MKRSCGVLAAACFSLFILSACTAPAASPVGATNPPPAVTTPAPVTPIATASRAATAAPTRTQTAATATAALPTPTRSSAIRLDETFTLKIGESATLSNASDTRVSFLSVLEDTRCPADVNCVQAGNVRVLVGIESGGKLARFDLSALPYDIRRIAAFNGYLLQFLDLAPPRKTTTTILPGDYQVTLRVSAGSLSSSPARFNQAFTLKVGQSTGFEGSSLRLTFEGVKQDSRCPARANCPSSGTATVAVRLVYDSVNQEQILLGVDGSPVMTTFPITGKVTGAVRANALTPYPQQDSASKEIVPDGYEATLVIVNPAVPLATLTPVQPVSCPDLTRADAQAILGEPVKDQPANIILFPLPTNSITLNGLCGYGSVAFTPSKPSPSDGPRVLPATVQSDHAVMAGKLTGNPALEQLLSLASAIDAANSRGASYLYDRLLASYNAGVGSHGALAAFPEAVRDATNVHVSKVGSLGDSAIWVWREFEGGHYAALVAEKGETFFLIVALTNSQRSEDALFGSMMPVMQDIIR